MNENEEILDLLAWAFREAEAWLFDSVGRQYHTCANPKPEAIKIRRILMDHGKYNPLFDDEEDML